MEILWINGGFLEYADLWLQYFLMDKISKTKTYGHSTIAFVLYFTGLFNLMFNWGHHIYTLPTHAYVKHISYAVSMTELFILGRIIYLWRASLSTAKKHFYSFSYRFLAAADVWIFLTLLLAICMSIPAINVYTHGTHITVAHTMGATIGINSFYYLLLDSIFCMIPAELLNLIKNVYHWVLAYQYFTIYFLDFIDRSRGNESTLANEYIASSI